MKQLHLTLGPTLDAEHGAAFRKEIQHALLQNPQELILDCTTLNYIDSTGLGLLTLANTEASKFKCKFILSGVNGHPRNVLDMMKFDQLFTIHYSSENN